MHCKETFKMMLPVRIRADSVWSSCMLTETSQFLTSSHWKYEIWVWWSGWKIVPVQGLVAQRSRRRHAHSDCNMSRAHGFPHDGIRADVASVLAADSCRRFDLSWIDILNVFTYWTVLFVSAKLGSVLHEDIKRKGKSLCSQQRWSPVQLTCLPLPPAEPCIFLLAQLRLLCLPIDASFYVLPVSKLLV